MRSEHVPRRRQLHGKLVGNTGEPNKLTIALRSSFSARRGEFVRVAHQERESESHSTCWAASWALGSNILFSPALGEGISEVELLPQSRLSGETSTRRSSWSATRIRSPARSGSSTSADPGDEGLRGRLRVPHELLRVLRGHSIHLGNLVGYEKGENIVPVFLDANTLVTEHLAVLAMTGSGKSYTVGRIIERLVSQLNALGRGLRPARRVRQGLSGRQAQLQRPARQGRGSSRPAEARRDPDALQKLQERGGGIKVYTPQLRSFDEKYAGKNERLALQLDHFEVDEFSGSFLA